MAIFHDLEKGTPQGGILSPLIWNLAFDDLLERFDSSPVLSVGFADDVGLVTSGPCMHTQFDQMQQAIAKTEAWADSSGLTLSVEKTIAVIFTRKNKLPNIAKLKVYGREIKFSPTVKYLGITLDAKLHFTHHILDKCNKAKQLLMLLKHAVGMYWGPPPIQMRWILTGIIRPMLTYGSLVWAQQAQYKGDDTF